MRTLNEEYLQERVNKIISYTNLKLRDFNPGIYWQHIRERVKEILDNSNFRIEQLSYNKPYTKLNLIKILK